MKLITLFFLLLTGALHSQAQVGQVVSVNATTFMQIVDSSNRCVLMKLWVPNCPTAKEQFKEYMDFSAHSDITVIYIGITSIPEKITTIANAHGFQGILYMLDTTIAKDIYQRPDLFCKELSARLKKSGQKRFSTMMIDRKNKVVLQDDTPDFPVRLKQLCS